MHRSPKTVRLPPPPSSSSPFASRTAFSIPISMAVRGSLAITVDSFLIKRFQQQFISTIIQQHQRSNSFMIDIMISRAAHAGRALQAP
jgi:hypothetical protein